MPMPKTVQVSPNATVIFGKPAKALSEDVIHKVRTSLASDEAVVEAYLPLYFILGSMPAPRLSLVLVARSDSQKESVALRARSILADLVLGQLVPDVWIMDGNDRLLSSVRRADCQLKSIGPNQK